MARGSVSWTPLIFGGIFVGFWIFGLIFGYPEWHTFRVMPWFFWGIVGLLIAGGLYAALVASETIRVVLIVVVEIALGLLIMATIVEKEAHIVASFLTAVGAGLIVAALPRPGAGAQAWQAVEERA